MDLSQETAEDVNEQTQQETISSITNDNIDSLDIQSLIGKTMSMFSESLNIDKKNELTSDPNTTKQMKNKILLNLL
jgi:hypothetical protein